MERAARPMGANFEHEGPSLGPVKFCGNFELIEWTLAPQCTPGRPYRSGQVRFITRLVAPVLSNLNLKGRGPLTQVASLRT